MPRKVKTPLSPDSLVIRTLNMLINDAAATIQWNQRLMKETFARYMQNGPYVVNVTTHEDRSREWHDHATHELRRVSEMAEEILILDQRISELTRTKLALFGDVDFRGGEEIAKKI